VDKCEITLRGWAVLGSNGRKATTNGLDDERDNILISASAAQT